MCYAGRQRQSLLCGMRGLLHTKFPLALRVVGVKGGVRVPAVPLVGAAALVLHLPRLSLGLPPAQQLSFANPGQGHLRCCGDVHHLKTAGGAHACLETLELRGWSSKRGGGMWGCPAAGPLGALCPFACTPFAGSSSGGGPGKRGVACAPALPSPVRQQPLFTTATEVWNMQLTASICRLTNGLATRAGPGSSAANAS